MRKARGEVAMWRSPCGNPGGYAFGLNFDGHDIVRTVPHGQMAAPDHHQQVLVSVDDDRVEVRLHARILTTGQLNAAYRRGHGGEVERDHPAGRSVFDRHGLVAVEIA